MTTSNPQPFRFLDLPNEIRHKVYKLLLCTFDSTPTFPSTVTEVPYHVPNQTNLNTMSYSLSPNILLTSKKVHREAYDIMVRTNQFIKVTTQNIQMSSLLLPFQVPIVCLGREKTEQFQGFVMGVKISAKINWVDELFDSINEEGGMDDVDEDIRAPPASTGPRFNFMILRRDWDAFCGMLAWADADIEGFSLDVEIVVELDPRMCADEREELPDYKAPITEFVTQNMRGLLEPWKRQCRGFRHVHIDGAYWGLSDELDVVLTRLLYKTANNIVTEVLSAVRAPLYEHHHDAIADFRETKKTADDLKENGTAGDKDRAIQWYDAALMKMRRLLKSATWSHILEEGGSPFATTFDEMFFTITVSLSELNLHKMQLADDYRQLGHRMSRVDRSAIIVEWGGNLNHDFDVYDRVRDILETSSAASTYEPELSLKGQGAYLQAACWRMIGQATTNDDIAEKAVRAAAAYITEAVLLAPQNNDVLDERHEIYVWGQEWGLFRVQ